MLATNIPTKTSFRPVAFHEKVGWVETRHIGPGLPISINSVPGNMEFSSIGGPNSPPHPVTRVLRQRRLFAHESAMGERARFATFTFSTFQGQRQFQNIDGGG